MRSLPARDGVRGRSRIRLSDALILRQHALGFCVHCSAPKASIAPPKKQHQRMLPAFSRRAPELHAADKRATPQALP